MSPTCKVETWLDGHLEAAFEGFENRLSTSLPRQPEQQRPSLINVEDARPGQYASSIKSANTASKVS